MPESNSINKNIVCMKWGNRYGAEYVNRLFKNVTRNMAGKVGKDYRFICITDNPTGLHQDIECKILPDMELPPKLANKPWLKLLVWDSPLFDLTGDALFLDVDVVITGSLDEFFTYKPEASFCVIHNWTEPKKQTGNTSVFRFKIGAHEYILRDFVRDMEGVHAQHKIEQRYISATISQQEFWPAEWCQSFKVNLLPPLPFRWWQTPKLPANCKIVVFHGKPDPDEAMLGKWPVKKWYKKFYKTVRPTPWIKEFWL